MTEENAFSTPEPRAVSLELELSNLATATRGAEILSDLETRRGLMDEEMEEDAPGAITAMLALVRGRIEQVRRVLRAEENPGNLWEPHNAVSLDDYLSEEVDGDVVLFPWVNRRAPIVIYHPLDFEPVTPSPKSQGKGRERKGPKRAKGKELTLVPPGTQREDPKEPPPGAS